MRRVIDRIKELSGIYGLGINPESAKGLAIPIAIVVLVGGAGWLFNKLFL
ncbi:MAG TPA: hypothetical protein VGR16_05095 [Thermomicrobiales bacterium]|nr:hypothetical protein [Thermomicrobiales bacterium]